MNLTVAERLVLQNILPKEGDYVTVKLVRKLRESLAFSEKEIADINFQNHWKCPKCGKVELSADVLKCEDCGIYMIPAGAVTWDEEKAGKVVKDVHLGKAMLKLCETSLQRLSDEKALKDEQLSLYEKFLQPDDQPGETEAE